VGAGCRLGWSAEQTKALHRLADRVERPPLREVLQRPTHSVLAVWRSGSGGTRMVAIDHRYNLAALRRLQGFATRAPHHTRWLTTTLTENTTYGTQAEGCGLNRVNRRVPKVLALGVMIGLVGCGGPASLMSEDGQSNPAIPPPADPDSLITYTVVSQDSSGNWSIPRTGTITKGEQWRLITTADSSARTTAEDGLVPMPIS